MHTGLVNEVVLLHLVLIGRLEFCLGFRVMKSVLDEKQTRLDLSFVASQSVIHCNLLRLVLLVLLSLISQTRGLHEPLICQLTFIKVAVGRTVL